MSNGIKQPDAIEFGEIPDMDTMKKQKAAAIEAGPNTDGTQNKDTKVADPAENASEFEMPEKFKDKSIEDVLTSYSNLESQLGHQAQEMGTLRKLNDQLLDLRTTEVKPQQETVPEVTADDVLNTPGKTIADIASREATGVVADTNTRVDQLEATLALSSFEGRHPTYVADQTDPAFQKFVQGSAYRTQLAQKVAGGDLGAGEELWSAWDEVKPSGTEQDKELTAEEKDAAETAAALAQRGGGEGPSNLPKPIPRAALAKIRIEEEDRYYSPEFQEYVQYMYKNKLVK